MGVRGPFRVVVRMSIEMYCFKAELAMLERDMRHSITLYREPGIGQGKVIKVTVEQKKGRSLLG